MESSYCKARMRLECLLSERGLNFNTQANADGLKRKGANENTTTAVATWYALQILQASHRHSIRQVPDRPQHLPRLRHEEAARDARRAAAEAREAMHGLRGTDHQ